MIDPKLVSDLVTAGAIVIVVAFIGACLALWLVMRG
jgi:hypothetical protein